jgi:hypothetical protein
MSVLAGENSRDGFDARRAEYPKKATAGSVCGKM